MSAFVVKKYTLDDCHFVQQDSTKASNKNENEKEEKLHIEKYCITSNTITYGLIRRMSPSSSINYFSCFPHDDSSSSYGILPTWGICQSQSTGLRYYGFLPYGHSLLHVESKNSKAGFMDISQKRKVLSPVYATYLNLECDAYLKELIADKSMKKEQIDDYENRYMILRGLFLTSFLILS